MRDNPNNRVETYNTDNPYRPFLIASLEHFKITSFTKQQPMITLGGIGWFEYSHLKDNGIQFGNSSYINIDKDDNDKILPEPDQNTTHQKMDFHDIEQLPETKHALALSYDTTMCLIVSNTIKWQDFIEIALTITKTTGKIFICWNFMVSYATIPLPSEIDHHRMTPKDSMKLYDRWLQMLHGLAKEQKTKCQFYPSRKKIVSILAPKDNSPTPMIAGSALLIHSK